MILDFEGWYDTSYGIPAKLLKLQKTQTRVKFVPLNILSGQYVPTSPKYGVVYKIKSEEQNGKYEDTGFVLKTMKATPQNVIIFQKELTVGSMPRIQEVGPRIYGYHVDKDKLTYIMDNVASIDCENCKSMSLEKYLENTCPRPGDKIYSMLRNVILSFYYITAGWHGDLTEKNIIVILKNGQLHSLKIIDYGSHKSFINKTHAPDCLRGMFNKITRNYERKPGRQQGTFTEGPIGSKIPNLGKPFRMNYKTLKPQIINDIIAENNRIMKRGTPLPKKPNSLPNSPEPNSPPSSPPLPRASLRNKIKSFVLRSVDRLVESNKVPGLKGLKRYAETNEAANQIKRIKSIPKTVMNRLKSEIQKVERANTAKTLREATEKFRKKMKIEYARGDVVPTERLRYLHQKKKNMEIMQERLIKEKEAKRIANKLNSYRFIPLPRRRFY